MTHGAEETGERLLRTAFLAGAVVDLAVAVVMLVPPLARLLWGLEGYTDLYRFATAFGASLMLGWTLLLIWASRRPRERRFVALLTVPVIIGLAAALCYLAVSGLAQPARLIPSWVVQAVLLALFLRAYVLTGKRE